MGRIWNFAVVSCFTVWISAGIAFPQQPDGFESLLASAQQAQARGDFEGAAASYRRAIALHPEIAELQANLGLMYYQTGKDQQAIAAFQQAIRLKPGLFVPNLFLGLDYVRHQQFEDAIPYLRRATSLNPSDPQAQLALGQAYTAIGKTQLAIPLYVHAVQLEPAKADGWFHLGVAYLQQLEADARLLLDRHKDSAYLHALTAETFAEQRAFAEAGNAYKETLAGGTFPSDTHAGYAFVLLNQHDFAGAQRELDAEVASNPGSLTARLGLARLRIEQDGVSEGAQELLEIWKADSAFLRANAWRLEEVPQDRVSELESALKAGSSKDETLGKIYVALFHSTPENQTADLSDLTIAVANKSPTGKDDQTASELYASGRYRECSDLLSSRMQKLQSAELRLLASCSYSTGKYQIAFDAAQRLGQNSATEAEGLYWEINSAQKLATRALARASELDSNSPTLHVLLGDIHRERKQYADAKSEYQKALAVQPEDIGAVFGLSLSMLADSDTEGALRVARAALVRSPDDPELNAVMGEILSAQGQFSDAERYLKRALKAKPDLLPHVHALLGRVYAETNRAQQAISELKLGLADDKDGHVHYQLAHLYQKVGDRVSAQKALAQSVRIQHESLDTPMFARRQGDSNSSPQ